VVPASGAAAAAAAAAAVAAVEADPRNEVEEEGEEFAAYCRRGKGRRRVEMEDRHVAKVALGGDPQVVISIALTLCFDVCSFLVILKKIKKTNLELSFSGDYSGVLGRKICVVSSEIALRTRT
jgi:hypothetical protein